jgi:FixJ family two-component response regulator
LRVELFGSAPELLQTKLPDVASCLVLDIRLPKRSGLDFQAELAKANIEIPIIFITGHGDVPMSVRAMKAGAIDFLIKPFRDQDLLDAVTIALEGDRKRREESKGREELKGLFEKLTPRLMNKQIAAEMGVTEITVKIHRGPGHAKDEREVACRARTHGRGARHARRETALGLNIIMSSPMWGRRSRHFGMLIEDRAPLTIISHFVTDDHHSHSVLPHGVAVIYFIRASTRLLSPR